MGISDDEVIVKKTTAAKGKAVAKPKPTPVTTKIDLDSDDDDDSKWMWSIGEEIDRSCDFSSYSIHSQETICSCQSGVDPRALGG